MKKGTQHVVPRPVELGCVGAERITVEWLSRHDRAAIAAGSSGASAAVEIRAYQESHQESMRP